MVVSSEHITEQKSIIHHLDQRTEEDRTTYHKPAPMRLSLALLLLSKSAHGFATLPSRRVVPSVLSSAIEDADTAVAAAGVDDQLDALLQEEGGDLEALLQEDGLFGEEVPEETTSDDTDVIGQFLAMMDDTPPGKLDEEELSLLRGTMQELMATPEKAEDVQKTLFRMLDEYEHAARTRDRERMEIVTPTPQDFELVRNSTTDCVFLHCIDVPRLLTFQLSFLCRRHKPGPTLVTRVCTTRLLPCFSNKTSSFVMLEFVRPHCKWWKLPCMHWPNLVVEMPIARHMISFSNWRTIN